MNRIQRTIDALRKPDASLARVPNTVRQAMADAIEEAVQNAREDERRACAMVYRKIRSAHWNSMAAQGEITTANVPALIDADHAEFLRLCGEEGK